MVRRDHPGANGTCTAPCVNGTQGPPGANGTCTAPCVNGTQGPPGANGTCTAPCVNGTQGPQGPPGANGTNCNCNNAITSINNVSAGTNGSFELLPGSYIEVTSNATGTLLISVLADIAPTEETVVARDEQGNAYVFKLYASEVHASAREGGPFAFTANLNTDDQFEYRFAIQPSGYMNWAPDAGVAFDTALGRFGPATLVVGDPTTEFISGAPNNLLVTGYLAAGVNATPVNTGVGDVTGARLMIGTPQTTFGNASTAQFYGLVGSAASGAVCGINATMRIDASSGGGAATMIGQYLATSFSVSSAYETTASIVATRSANLISGNASLDTAFPIIPQFIALDARNQGLAASAGNGGLQLVTVVNPAWPPPTTSATR